VISFAASRPVLAPMEEGLRALIRSFSWPDQVRQSGTCAFWRAGMSTATTDSHSTSGQNGAHRADVASSEVKEAMLFDDPIARHSRTPPSSSSRP